MDHTYNLNGSFKPTLKRTADLDGPDFFPTPAWATRALIDRESFEGDIWEPACGNGAMSEVLQQTGRRVISSDLYDRGFGEIGQDFLACDRVCDNIVTNPPYNSAEGFVRSGLRNARRKLALLLRLAFLEGRNRHRTIFQCTPPTRVLVFSERVTFYLNGASPKGSGTTAYAWFVWTCKRRRAVHSSSGLDRAVSRSVTQSIWPVRTEPAPARASSGWRRCFRSGLR